MGRAPRVQEEGATYHIVSRGNDRRAIYRDAADARWFLLLLERTIVRYGWSCQAYCLMPNHYHLIARPPLGALSPAMRELNGGYSRLANRRHGRTGHLFQNRFFAVRVERDAHLLEACRYVVLNPVRAGLCVVPAAWRWSSYRACAGLRAGRPLVRTNELLELFSPRPETARAAYREFVADAPGRPARA